jgi:diguanylate cyclase (GGDEF)-like protein
LNDRQHVVIVDDDVLTLKLFTSIASDIKGVVVHPFNSSAEALAWCRGKDIALFVCDYNMPSPNGLQLTAIIRALPEFALVPIVIVTGQHERAVRYAALDAGATDFLQKPVDFREMSARLSTLLALQAAQSRLALQIGSLEASLLDAEERSRHHAERLEALWRIANNPNLREDELMAAILEVGASAMRPNQAFRGTLGRVEGESFHLISSVDVSGYTDLLGSRSPQPGARIPLAETIVGGVLRAGGGTRSWDDLEGSGDRSDRARSLGWRAMITTTFSAGGATYVLTFSSSEPTAKPFAEQDHAYTEVLASFFSAYYQQHWQSARLGHQLEHDSLTGLWNRMRFRSLGRAAFANDPAPAIAIADLVHFHALNEAHGHINGDAVLVEVAAALSAIAADGEVVARVGGNTFGIYLPDAPTPAALMRSVDRYGAVFDARMGIGDREGKYSLPVAARIGFAAAPAGGTTFDEVLLCAEGRALAVNTHPDQRTFPPR